LVTTSLHIEKKAHIFRILEKKTPFCYVILFCGYTDKYY